MHLKDLGVLGWEGGVYRSWVWDGGGFRFWNSGRSPGFVKVKRCGLRFAFVSVSAFPDVWRPRQPTGVRCLLCVACVYHVYGMGVRHASMMCRACVPVHSVEVRRATVSAWDV